jgi:hypothetical protein
LKPMLACLFKTIFVVRCQFFFTASLLCSFASSLRVWDDGCFIVFF